jgi:hypothetical protein
MTAGRRSRGKNGPYARGRDDGIIEYDVSHVKAPRPEKDPAIDGLRPKPMTKRRRRRKTLSPELERYRLYTEDELGECPPLTWLIDGHLAAGELTVFYGLGATYKSFVALDWAYWLALQGRIAVYIAAEGVSGMRARVAAWKKHNRVDELPSLRFMPSPVPLHFPVPVGHFLAAMREQLGTQRPSLVVVDTLARNFVGGNENNPQDLGLFVEGVERVRRELATAVLVLHHSTKDGRSERGTQSLRNASFAMFGFEKINQNPIARVKCDRMKDAEPPPRTTVRPVKVELPELGEGVSSLAANWPYGGTDSRPADEEPRRESDASLSRREQQILGAIHGANSGANPAYLAKTLEIGVRTASRDANALVKKGFLSVEGKTKDRLFSLTAAGRRTVE